MEVTDEKIAEWKAKYGRVKKLTVEGVPYYYRPINLDEYYNVEQLVSNGDGVAYGEVETAKTGLLAPELPANPPAGIVLKLSDEILKLSGFAQDSPPEEL